MGRAIWAYPSGEVARVEHFVNQMSLKEIGAIQTIVDARRVTLQEAYAASFLPGDRVEFDSKGYGHHGTIIQSKNASVEIQIDDVAHAGTIETINAIWWVRAERIVRSDSPAPISLDNDSE